MGKRPDLTARNKTDNPAWRPDVKSKISASRKGKPTTSGKPCLPETRAKIAAALKGRKTGRRPTEKSIAAFVAGGRKNLRHESGPSHPNWKGGLTPARQKNYQSPEYRAFVNGVLERDNYTCQDCGARNGNGHNIPLQAHHIIPYAERPDLRYKISNGLTLCFPCHNKTKRNHPRPKLKQTASL